MNSIAFVNMTQSEHFHSNYPLTLQLKEEKILEALSK